MNTFDWNSFLAQWSEDVISTPDLCEKLPADFVKSKWLGYPGANEKQITQKERELGVSLPPSYQEFIKISNGWKQCGYFAGRLLSIEETNWLSVLNPNLINTWTKVDERNEKWEELEDEEYLAYDETGHAKGDMRLEYYKTALQVSEWYRFHASVILLNPKIITSNDGEWEACFFATWQLGSERYRTFQDLMVSIHQSILRLRDE